MSYEADSVATRPTIPTHVPESTSAKIRPREWMIFFEADHPYDRWFASFSASRVRSPGRRDSQRWLQRIARAASPAGSLSGAHAH